MSKINIALFRAALASKGYTQEKLAKEMHIAVSTMIRKVKNNSFTLSEAEDIIRILDIQNPCDIFFPKKTLDK